MKQKIKVLRNKLGETVEVDATIYGQLAVHRELSWGAWSNRTWTISHVLSGYAIEDGYTYRQAIKVAKELHTLGFDFDAFYKSGGDRNQSLYSEAKGIVNRAKGIKDNR